MLPYQFNSLLDGVRARVDVSHSGLRWVSALTQWHAQLRLLTHYLNSRLVTYRCQMLSNWTYRLTLTVLLDFELLLKGCRVVCNQSQLLLTGRVQRELLQHLSTLVMRIVRVLLTDSVYVISDRYSRRIKLLNVELAGTLILAIGQVHARLLSAFLQ